MKGTTNLRIASLVLLCAGTLALAAHETTSKSLADRLGGYKAISAVVDQFVANVGGDARINKFFAKTDLGKLKKQLKDQICEAAGGFYDAKRKKPCTYHGRGMKEAHAGMGVQDADFTALVEDLVKALDKFKVPETEKNELLAVLGPMKGAIVEPKSTATTTTGTTAQ